MVKDNASSNDSRLISTIYITEAFDDNDFIERSNLHALTI